MNFTGSTYYMEHPFHDTPISMHPVEIRNNQCQKHAHSFYELSYVTAGQGTLSIDDSCIPITRGDLLFIPTDTRHVFQTTLNQSVTLMNCLVEKHILSGPQAIGDRMIYDDIDELTQPFRTLGNGFKVTENKKEFGKIMYSLHLELQCKESGYRYRLYLHLMDLLTRIRHAEPSDLQSAQGDLTDHIQLAVNYISSHYNESAILTRLCERFAISPRHFQRTFKQVTGLTLTQMIQNKRIQRSCELLSETDWSVQTIAREVGIQDMKYFYRIFKEKCGMTPKEFRQPQGS